MHERLILLVAHLRQHLETGYLVIFALYLASVTIQTTTMVPFYPHRVGSVIQLLTIGLLFLKIVCLDSLTDRQIIGEVALLSLVAIVTLTSGAHYLVTTVLLILGARGVRFRRILQVYLIVVGSILLVALVAAEIGLIQNITFKTSDGVRQSLGVLYTTDFAAHVFYLACAYLYVRARQFRLLDLWPVLVGLATIYFLTKTMTDVICMLLLIVGYLFYIYRRQLVMVKPLMVGLRYSFLTMPLVAGVIIWLSTAFNYQDHGFAKLNQLLSSRLALGNNALLAYGVKLFGQAPIPVNGWGGDRVDTFKNGIGELTYFFIDSSFLNSLIAYGLLLTLVIVLGSSYLAYHRSQQHDYLLPLMLALAAISSAFDQHLLEVTYNVFILAFVAELPRYQTSIGPAFDQPVIGLQFDGEAR